MNVGGQGGQGGMGAGGVGAGGGQNTPSQVTTSSQQNGPTTTTGFATSTTTSHPTTSTSSSPSSSSTSAASSSSGVGKALIGGVVGGIGGLLLLSLLAIWLLQRRKNKRIQEKNGAQPITYAGLNESLAGVPFVHHSNNSNPSHNQNNRDSLLPPALFTSSTNTSSNPGVGIRGGEAPPTPPGGRDSGDYFLPSYAQSQSGMSIGGPSALGHLDTSHHTPSEATISPMSTHHQDDTTFISPQTTGAAAQMISPQTTGYTNVSVTSPQTPGPPPFLSHHNRELTRDTMGFPTIIPPETLNNEPTPIMAPMPRHPLVHQASLERAVREGMMSPDQDPSRLGSPAVTVRESAVLGEQNPVRMVGQGQGPPLSHQNGSNLGRNVSQRTVDSVSTMGVSVVSDGELERLGVGARGRYGR